MKAPVGLLSDRTVLRSKMEGPRPDKFTLTRLDFCGTAYFEQDEAQKVIDTLEAIPAEERTPELDSELAKAYIAIADMGDREPFEKALELLAPHETYFAGDHCWNYRIALAYYCLDEEGPALRYFEKALKARPGDKDTQEYINDCRRRLSLPRFEKNFRERTQEAWAAFSQIEAELRQIIDIKSLPQKNASHFVRGFLRLNHFAQ